MIRNAGLGTQCRREPPRAAWRQQEGAEAENKRPQLSVLAVQEII